MDSENNGMSSIWFGDWHLGDMITYTKDFYIRKCLVIIEIITVP